MKWPFTKAIVNVELIRRGAGKVRRLTLECGHTLETMHLVKGTTRKLCEVCRKAA